MSQLFASVLRMSLMASYIIPFVLVARLLLRRAPKVFAYALWGTAFFRLLCPLTMPAPVSLIPQGVQSALTNVVPAQTAVGAVAAARQASPLLSASSDQIARLTPVWVAGLALLLAAHLLLALRLRARLATATLVQANIFETDRIRTPFVFGLFRPRIYLPVGLSAAEREHVIQHEQAHLRRCDHLVKPLAFCALALHWFNPLVWLAYAQMSKDMELSCDESVLRQSAGDIRRNYSGSLLALSVRQSGLPDLLAFGESNIKSRVSNVLNYRRPRAWLPWTAGLAVLVVTIGLLVNPLGDAIYRNDQYGYSLVMPRSFARDVQVRDEGECVYFVYKPVQAMEPSSPFGVVGRLEIYLKANNGLEQFQAASGMYRLELIAENDLYYFGLAHASDVQIPPEASDRYLPRYRELEAEFDQMIKSFQLIGR